MTVGDLSLSQRFVLRLYGVKVSDDGMRWTAPRKRRPFIEGAFTQARDNAWREGTPAVLTHQDWGISVSFACSKIELRWID